MLVSLDKKQLGLALILLGAFPLTSYSIDKKFEIEPAALAKKYPMPTPPPKTKAVPKTAGTVSYKVKPGDFLYRVLAREYGITGDRADAVARRVQSANHLADVRRLRVGTILLIPIDATEHAARPKSHRAVKVAAKPDRIAPPQVKGATMMFFKAPAAHPAGPQEPVAPPVTVQDAAQVWPQLVPNAPSSKAQLDYLSSAFSLSLDPQRYPVLAAQDGGTILVDSGASLPPLVKSLLQEKNPQLTVISERPDNPRAFYRALLTAARFYSFEEDFLVDFGTDCKVIVQADFKIEKSQDSLLRQDITLLKVPGKRPATPQALVRLLATHGFKLVETPSTAPIITGRPDDSVLYQIPEKDPRSIADALLEALGIRFQADKSIDLYAGDNNGVRLEIPVYRYFEKNGRRYVLARFQGNPLGESLTNLLEGKGYQVIQIQDHDDLQSLSDKLLNRMDVAGRYGEQELWSLWENGYGVRMPGVMLNDAKGGRIFITDRKVDPLVQELAKLNGYRQEIR
ncbi:LysM peptidoglycan-binding domain-containing protein [Geomonas oryzisoli]|uniref:LysM peptidoglycan-binding domain-containing protein n=1 Tax=Geomonas oryzisoli TaxID=2847992 RepID=A0ABX8J708_9BACT|nr:LysM peptidoglycan-binding domain-containing protein [Geomonas oryzisoli]QWV94130.1 LysM peptidoglycan-binding domain-containing protein [Geomonas oryzisoli]